METFEISINGELFRVSERIQSSGRPAYDFAWLNGPVDGTYGFTTWFHFAMRGQDATYTAAEPPSLSDADLRTRLNNSVREFVEDFYAPGDIGEADFPEHRPASGG